MKTTSETVYAIHPRTGDKIVNVHDNVLGIRADLVTAKGRVRLAGTWAFAPELSFTVLDDKSAAECGIPILTGYVTVAGAWQY